VPDIIVITAKIEIFFVTLVKSGDPSATFKQESTALVYGSEQRRRHIRLIL